MTSHYIRAQWTRAARFVTLALTVGLSIVAVTAGTLNASDESPQNVGVASVEPSMRADRESNITITFTDDLVPDDSLDRSVVDPPLQFDPPIEGVARWADNNVLRFYPDAMLRPATEYRLKVKSAKEYLHGSRINEERTFQFATPNFQITDVTYRTEPATGFMLPHIKMVIRIEFNYPVPIEQLRKRLKLTGEDNATRRAPDIEVRQAGVPPLALSPDAWQEFDTEAGPRRYSYDIISEAVMLTGEPQRYRLRVASGLACQDCGKGLTEDFIHTVIVEPKGRLVVHSVHPQSAVTHFNLQVYLSGTLDQEEIKDYVVIEPEMKYALLTSRSGLLISGEFKSGQSYTLTLKKGLPALNGQVLERQFSTVVEVPDLPPSIDFSSPGVFLPREGAGNIELKSTNVDEVLITVEQVFENNLVHYLTGHLGDFRYGYRYAYGYGSSMDQYARRVFFKETVLRHEPNTPLVSTIDVADILGDTSRGIYVINVSSKDQRSVSDGRKVMMTDIGITARMGDNHLLAWVHSLSGTKPLRHADVRLISKNNQVLAEGETDSRGIVTFDKLEQLTEGYEPYVITVSHENDLSFLRFNDCLLPTSDFDVTGRPYLVSGYEAFVYTDRGVYRPGDSLHLVTMVRDQDADVPPKFPYRVIIRDPQGRLFAELKLNTDDALLTVVDYAIPDFALTGRYAVTVQIGDEYEIGHGEFQVEEFMPDRINVRLSTSRNSYRPGDSLDAEVVAKFLFGPPAQSFAVSGNITIEEDQFKPEGWSDFSFTSRNRSYTKTEISMPDTTLDSEGRHVYKPVLPKRMEAPSALKALAAVLVKEPGGRAVGAYKELTIHPYDRYLGLHVKLDSYAKPGERVEAEVVALTPAGDTTSTQGVVASFRKIVHQTVLRLDRNGEYRYVSERSSQMVDSVIVDVSAQGVTVGFTPPDYGRYEIEVQDGSRGHAASDEFFASGWGYAPWSMTDPERIELDLDQEVYSPGANAMLQVRTPFPGKLLVTIERERVLETITVEMEENTAAIQLPVKQDYFPNVYVTATLVRPAAEITAHSPARAFGIAPLRIANDAWRLPISIDAPEVIEPQTNLTVDLQAGQSKGTEITVAAVDAGILQLTEFETPDPLSFFCGRRRPYLSQYDMYSFIYPEVERAASHLSAAGGARFAAARLRHLTPVAARRVKSVALWSGRVQTDDSGHAQVTFEVPQFNGKLVIMAVGASTDRFGSATQETTVRDRIVLQESFPRFVAPNDSITGMATVFNNTGRDAKIEVRLKIDGPMEHTSGDVKAIELANSTSGIVVFPLRASLQPGTISLKLSATCPGDTAELDFEMPNRAAQPLKSISSSGVVVEGQPATFELPGEWLEGTDEYVLRTSSVAAVAFASNIQYLLTYPYGCLEQTTSRLFPLLYFNDLAKFVQPGVFNQGGPDYFIQEGLVRLNSMSLSEGGFSFWPDGQHRRHVWSSIYASHFIVEARKAGYFLGSNLYQRALADVQDIARGKNNDADHSHRIYAAFVLGKAGKLEARIVNYLKGLVFRDLPAFSQYQLAGALAMAGEVDQAREMLPRDIQTDLFEPETGGHFNSGVRTTAILLDVLLLIDPNHPSAPAVAQSLMESIRIDRWHTTQSNAFALMALGVFFKDKDAGNFSGTVTIEGESAQSIDSVSFQLKRKDLAGKQVTISIEGKGSCFYSWQASGISSAHVAEEFDRGIIVRREYLDENGRALGTKNVALGDRVICRLTASAVEKTLHNVVINDLIPAGFAIENPRIKTTPSLAWIPKSSRPVDYQDIRDDRLLLFTDLEVGAQRQLEYYYSLRAVTAGEFVVPPVAAECMYNPVIAGSASSGRMAIVRTKR